MKTTLGLTARVAILSGFSLLLASCASEGPALLNGSHNATMEPTSSASEEVRSSGEEAGQSRVEARAEDHESEVVEPERTLPSCTEAIPLDKAREIMPATQVVFESEKFESRFIDEDRRLGPAAREAFRKADRVSSCTWYVPNSDSFLHFQWAQLSFEVRDEFLRELRASDYVEEELHGDPMFSYDDGERGLGVGLMQFGFVDNLLVYTQSPEPHHLSGVMTALQEQA